MAVANSTEYCVKYTLACGELKGATVTADFNTLAEARQYAARALRDTHESHPRIYRRGVSRDYFMEQADLRYEMPT